MVAQVHQRSAHPIIMQAVVVVQRHRLLMAMEVSAVEAMVAETEEWLVHKALMGLVVAAVVQPFNLSLVHQVVTGS